MVYSFGVDLGTTFSAAAIHRDGQTSMVPLGTDRPEIPSVLLLRSDGTILAGDAAARRASTEPEQVVREFKRRLGDPTPIIIAGSPYSAEALTARLLASIVAAVVSSEGQDYERIAITHPANWGNFKLDLLKQAVQMAGVNPSKVQLLSEPQAAAISYAANQRVAVGETFAVYDLGGGTFDAAVVRRTTAGFDLVGRPEGIERLGGIDFDAALYAHVVQSLAAELQGLDPQDPSVLSAVSRLKADCVAAKEALSSDTDVTITVSLPQHHGQVRLTRSEFESIIRPPLLESVAATVRAIRASGLEVSDIDRILLAGGSSRIPLVGQLVSAELGRPTSVDAHPKHAVALGAALAASGAQALPAAAPGATGVVAAVATPIAAATAASAPTGIQEPVGPAPTGSLPTSPAPAAAVGPATGAFDPAATIVNPDVASASPGPPAGSPSPLPASSAAKTDMGPSNPLHAYPPPSVPSTAGPSTTGPSTTGPSTTGSGREQSFDPDATTHLPTVDSGIASASPVGPSVLSADSGSQRATTTGFGPGPTPVSGPARWENAARPPTSLRARRNLLAALVVLALLVGGGATWALARDDGPTTGSAASAAVVDMDGDGDIDEDDDAIVAAELEIDDDPEDDDEQEGDPSNTESDDAEADDVDLTDGERREDSDRSTTSTSPSTTEGNTTSLKVTTTSEETTTTSSSTTSSSTTTSSTTSPPSGDMPIQIVSGPSVSDVTGTSFRFSYSTNDVCGDGVFTVRNKANNAVAGTWNGTGGCFGPGHGGSPGTPGPFSGFNLEPGTTYVVSITVNGTPASGGRAGGTGSANTSFEVTTSG